MVRDAETGELRAPTEEEFRELQPAPTVDRGGARDGEPAEALGRKSPPSRTPQQQLEVEHPDGAVSIALDESTVSYAVARRTADGKVAMTETSGAKAASAAVAQGAAKPGAGAKGVKHAK